MERGKKSSVDTLATLSEQTFIGPYFISNVHWAAGDKEQTLSWLEKGYEIRDPNMPYIGDGSYASFLKLFLSSDVSWAFEWGGGTMTRERLH